MMFSMPSLSEKVKFLTLFVKPIFHRHYFQTSSFPNLRSYIAFSKKLDFSDYHSRLQLSDCHSYLSLLSVIEFSD